jgi:hypothetical protein
VSRCLKYSNQCHELNIGTRERDRILITPKQDQTGKSTCEKTSDGGHRKLIKQDLANASKASDWPLTMYERAAAGGTDCLKESSTPTYYELNLRHIAASMSLGNV